MAFLVCYSSHPPDDHAQKKAVYLDQGFYEMIFTRCRSVQAGYGVLREVASLRYKSPTLVVEKDRLAELDEELRKLGSLGPAHPQVADLRAVCAKAQADECALTISGDMYPELRGKG